MRRYAFNTDSEPEATECYDVVIVGGGLAGLYTALLLDDALSVALLVKDRLFSCNSSLAQGGIAAVTHPRDSAERHISDTMKAGGVTADRQAVETMVREGPAEIRTLESMGVVFDTDAQGDRNITREGGHTEKRVLHCGGDATGDHIIHTLSSHAVSRKNIRIMEKCFLADILTTGERGSVCGVTVMRGKPETIRTARVVVASGGIGQVYRYTTNQQGITGDGIAAAMRAGAKCRDMEFVQFHPTAFYDTRKEAADFLISEAVRGEGGILRNHEGVAFMGNYHPMKDLAPRDVVARAIFTEIRSSGKNHVFLDCTSQPPAFLEKRFPTIFNNCLKAGVNMAQHPIPVAPVQHYFMGGVDVTLQGQSTVDGLYAIGEAACTGAHGANRLASNSLLECLVFSRQCARHINSKPIRHPGTAIIPSTRARTSRQAVRWEDCRRKIRHLMQEYGGIVRSKKGLQYALGQVEGIIADLETVPMTLQFHTETYNMALIAREILFSALRRTRNAGAHYCIDNVTTT